MPKKTLVKKSINLFFLILTSLFTTFFYQNCSEIESTTVQTGPIEYLPLLTNQMKLFGSQAVESDSQPSRCQNLHEILYSQEHNLCFELKDSCTFAQLAENGFKPVKQNLGRKLENNAEVENTDLKALIQNCQLFVDINDLRPIDFSIVNVATLGFKQDPNLMCSQSLEPLVNFKNRTCLTATDGCQSTFLKKLGYVKDFYSICPQSL